MTEPILIVGAGAIGGTLGAAFIRAGHSVVFVGIFTGNRDHSICGLGLLK